MSAHNENERSAHLARDTSDDVMYRDSMAAMLGIQSKAGSDGYAEIFVEATDAHCNVHGFVHGVVLFAMADIGMGWMLDRHIRIDKRITTLSLNSNFLSPVKRGRIDAETEIVQVGNTVATLRSRIYDSRGADKALFTGIFHMSEARK